MLGLDADAVALDIGSGYGAITHSLARSFKRVYSLEAISQRVEFMKIRLEQENIQNVQLLQGSALSLPFFDQTFDLIVVNGVLEWVGDWQTGKSPRLIQVEFLQRLSRLLKDGGVLIIGIENRLSYETLRGAIDHSGMRYTNFMPRRFATFWLRIFGSAYRSSAKRTEYRTYTYSERGYRAILAEAGLRGEYYWSYPGYNEPYGLIPLDNKLIANQIASGSTQPSQAARRNWRSDVGTTLARFGVLRFLVPEFLIVAVKNTDVGGMSRGRLWNLIEDLVSTESRLEDPRIVLSTHAFNKKSVLFLFDKTDVAPRLVIKTSAVSNGSLIEREFANLSLANSLVQRSSPGFAVPPPITYFRIGNFTYSIELPAAGQQFSRLLFSNPPSRWLDCLRHELPRYIEIAVDIARTLKGQRSVDMADPAWWDLDGLKDIDSLHAHNGAREVPELMDWVQHGDYTAENVLLDRSTGQVSIIDWEHLVRGVPPLYDVFSLLLSLVPAVVVKEFKRRDSSECQFRSAFFGGGPFADLFRKMVLNACDGLSILESDVWKMFVQTLTLRRNYHASRGSWSWAESESQYLQVAVENRKEFIMRG